MKAILAVLTLIFATACASNNTGKTYQGTDTGKPIHVLGTGYTLEDAKTNGFNEAIQQVVGTIILADAEMRNQDLIRNDIAKHSAGYVDSYKVINQTVSGNKYLIEMDVVVKHSSIAERVLTKNIDSTNINGDRMATQYKTYLDDRKTGDNIITNVLADFPKKAFQLTKGDTQYRLDTERNAIISVKYKLEWSYNYIKALNELLAVTQDGKNSNVKQYRIIVQSKDPNAWLLGQTDVYYFNDRARAFMYKHGLYADLYVVAKIMNNEGQTIFMGCSSNSSWGDRSDYHTTFIEMKNYVQTELYIKIPSYSNKLKDFSTANKIDLSYTTDPSECFNFKN